MITYIYLAQRQLMLQPLTLDSLRGGRAMIRSSSGGGGGLGSSDRPSVLLVTSTPRCTATNGQYFMMRALQSKNAFARRVGWKLFTTSGHELSIAGTTSLLAATGDELGGAVDPEAQWPALLVQALSQPLAAGVDWLVWMDSDVLVSDERVSASLLRWSEWEQAGTRLVLLARSSISSGLSTVASPRPLDLAVAFVRVHDDSRALLEAWSDSIATNAASSGANASLALWQTLSSRPAWQSSLRVIGPSDAWLGELPTRAERAKSRPWLTSFRQCSICAASARAGGPDLAGGRSGRVPWYELEEDIHAGPRVTHPAALPAVTVACRSALLRALTSANDAGPLSRMGAMHASSVSVHIRPIDTADSAVSTWLQRHRGGLGRCLPSLLIVGSQVRDLTVSPPLDHLL